MKWTREEYLQYMTFGRVERPMFVELFGPLVGLEDEWRRQGASEEEVSLVAFEWDTVTVVGAGCHCGLRGGQEPRLIEETDEYVIRTDALGRRTKLCKGFATIPLPLDYPVANMDDWLRLKPQFTWHEDRIDWSAVEAARKAQQAGALVVAGLPGAWAMPRELMGDEAVCVAYYEQPELVHDILDTLRETAMQVFHRVSEKLTIDQLSVGEDLAGKSGPLAGPAQVGEFFHPYYRPVRDLLFSRGTRMFEMDTDGDASAILDALLDAGLTATHPCEPVGGMDTVKLRAKYGKRLGMRGGIDKHVLRRGQSDIRAELEYKLQPAMRTGGMVFGLDHRIPNGTPLANYRYYVDTAREILGLPPREGKHKGWSRMAF